MSCNGCRILRKGCSETCILRPCLQWIQSPESQGHATVFVAKFFGRAGLMSFLSNVPDSHRPALFQSLLYEACGRTVNPVSGAVGLLWSGNWHLCQGAVETVLRGGTLKPIPPDFFLFSTNTASPAAHAPAPDPAPALPIDDHKYVLSSLSKLQQPTNEERERDLDFEQEQEQEQDQDRDLDLEDDDDDDDDEEEDDQNSGTTTAISTADNHRIYRNHQHQPSRSPEPTLLNLFF